MGKFKRIFHHISTEEVRKKWSDTLEENIARQFKEDEEKRILNNLVDEVKYSWKEELSDLWKQDWRDKLSEGMTTRMLTGTLPSTGDADLETLETGLSGNGDIDYGEPGTGDETMAGEGQYTCFSNLDDLQNVNDPNNVGTFLRLFDQNTKQFRSGQTGGGGHGYLQAIPGYVDGMMRNAKPSGDYNQAEKERRVRLGLPVLQGGSDLYYHIYGQTNDTLGLGYGNWNSNDGLTSANTGTRLDFNGPGSPRFAALKAIDSTGFDTIKIHALLGDDDIVNTYTEPGTGIVRDKRVQIYYWAGDHKDYVTHPSATQISGYGTVDGWRPINMKPNGELDSNVDPYIIKHTADRPSSAIDANGVSYSTDHKLSPYSIPIPDYARSKTARYMLVQVDVTSGDRFSVTSVKFQRKNTIKSPALTKPLSDVETSPFVRVGPTKKNEGGKERKKKVQNIIRSGLKYTGKQFGQDFPVRTDLK